MNKELKEIYNLINQIKNLNIDIKLKKNIISFLICKVTEINGKYEGVPYWSEKALELKGKKILYTKTLRHEHVWTRKYLVNELLGGKSAEDLSDKMVACIVTEEEHKILKDKEVGWERYKAAGIKYKKVS